MTFATAEDLNVRKSEINVGIKVTFGREIRRASLTEGLSIDHLKKLVAELFSLDKESLGLKYKDEDGDSITISVDKEVTEAVRIAQNNRSPLHLIAEVNAKVEPVPRTVEVKVESNLQDPSLAFSSLGLNPSHPNPLPSLPPSFSSPSSLPPLFSSPSSLPPISSPLPTSLPPPVDPSTLSSTPTITTTSSSSQPVNCGGREKRGRRDREEGARGGRRNRDDNNNNNNNDEEQNDEVRGRGGRRGGRGGARGRDAELVPVKEEKAEDEWKKQKREMREALRAVKQTGDQQALNELRAKMREDRKRFKTEHTAEERKDKNKKRKDLKMKVIADLTIPPGSALTPNTEVTKTWRVKNVGGVEWPAGSQLIFVGRRGETGALGSIENGGGAVNPGSEVEVKVTFVTPSTPGSYIARYRLATPEGDLFGKKVVVSFGVVGDGNI